MQDKKTRKVTISDTSVILQHESSEKYGGEHALFRRELNCIMSSTHTSTCPPITNSDLESHDSSVQFSHKRRLSVTKSKVCVCMLLHMHASRSARKQDMNW